MDRIGPVGRVRLAARGSGAKSEQFLEKTFSRCRCCQGTDASYYGGCQKGKTRYYPHERAFRRYARVETGRRQPIHPAHHTSEGRPPRLLCHERSEHFLNHANLPTRRSRCGLTVIGPRRPGPTNGVEARLQRAIRAGCRGRRPAGRGPCARRCLGWRAVPSVRCRGLPTAPACWAAVPGCLLSGVCPGSFPMT